MPRAVTASFADLGMRVRRQVLHNPRISGIEMRETKA